MAIANPYTASPVCGEGGGQPVQNVTFEWADGSQGTVNQLLRWADGRLLLLLFGSISAPALSRARALAGTAAVCCVQVVGSNDAPRAREHVRDPQGHLRAACHVFGHTWALVRPDAYVAATGEAVDGTLVNAVATALGALAPESIEA
jgi:3-(3-hydroxy-phenyl)propionate hydroxylase